MVALLRALYTAACLLVLASVAQAEPMRRRTAEITPRGSTLGAADDATSTCKKRRKRKSRRRRKRRPAPSSTSPRSSPSTESTLVPSSAMRGPTRIDFDDRLIQGQTNKSGAVYLFDRKETGIRSMVKRRKSFRHLTIQTVYDR